MTNWKFFSLFYCLPSENQVQLLRKGIAHLFAWFEASFKFTAKMVWDVQQGFVGNCISASATLLQFSYAVFAPLGPLKPMHYQVRTVFMVMIGFSSKYATKQTPNRMFSSLFFLLHFTFSWILWCFSSIETWTLSGMFQLVVGNRICRSTSSYCIQKLK